MKARGTPIALLTAMLLAAGCSEPQQPDVLLITIDTLRQDFVGAYGYPQNVSPNLDALAERSVLFERAIAASSRTAPSHASMMTSRWTREHSIAWVNGDSRLVGQQTLVSPSRTVHH